MRCQLSATAQIERKTVTGIRPRALTLHAPVRRCCALQGRAFALYSKAREGGAHVTAEDAIRQAQQALLQVGAAPAGHGAGAQQGSMDGQDCVAAYEGDRALVAGLGSKQAARLGCSARRDRLRTDRGFSWLRAAGARGPWRLG